MNGNQPDYRSYLLRIWRENADGEWRVLLQNITSGESRHFSCLDDLHEYLLTEPYQVCSERPITAKLPQLH